MYKFRLASKQQIASYNAFCKKHLKVEFPTEYLDRADIYLLTDKHGNIVGGAAFVQTGGFRSIECVPCPSTRNKLLDNYGGNDLAEINGVWLCPSIRKTKTIIYYWHCVLSIMLQTNKNYVFSCSTSNASLNRLYSGMASLRIYTGAIIPQPGCLGPFTENVYFLEARHFHNFDDFSHLIRSRYGRTWSRLSVSSHLPNSNALLAN